MCGGTAEIDFIEMSLVILAFPGSEPRILFVSKCRNMLISMAPCPFPDPNKV
jgi:hypothetical protein